MNCHFHCDCLQYYLHSISNITPLATLQFKQCTVLCVMGPFHSHLVPSIGIPGNEILIQSELQTQIGHVIHVTAPFTEGAIYQSQFKWVSFQVRILSSVSAGCFKCGTSKVQGHMVAKLVEALFYKPEGPWV